LASATLRDTLENGNLKPIEVDPEVPFVIARHPDPLKGRPQSLAVQDRGAEEELCITRGICAEPDGLTYLSLNIFQ